MSHVTRSVFRALLRAARACEAAHVPLDTWRSDALACLGPHAHAALDAVPAVAAPVAADDAARVRAAIRAAFRAPLPADAADATAAANARLDGALAALRRLSARAASHARSGGASAAAARSSRSSRVSHGMRCSVRSTFLPERSFPGEHVFRYDVTFLNEGAHPVQLATRAWAITTHHEDGSHSTAHVRGPGVVGQHPRLLVGESFTYSSFCALATRRGTMRGEFEWVSLTGEDTVRASLPPCVPVLVCTHVAR
jgi:ApaG protein